MLDATFRERELARFKESGQAAPPLRELLESAGLPTPVDYLAGATWWEEAARKAAHLREHFSNARFAEQVRYGIVLVPPVETIDVRGAVPAGCRVGLQGLDEDFVDPALGEGVDLTDGASGWTPFVSVVGRYGISEGSWEKVVAAHDRFVVDGHDTRRGMVRQLWGARLLLAPPGEVADFDGNDTWTFTLFPGEALVDGQAVSGTVLKGRVRFRLGKANRGIASARVSPALPLAESTVRERPARG